jgi:hypothetical protein
VTVDHRDADQWMSVAQGCMRRHAMKGSTRGFDRFSFFSTCSN